MKVQKNKKIFCVLVAAVLLFSSVFMSPFKAKVMADSAWSNLELSISTVSVKDIWQQTKNAAMVHLVVQKFKTCLDKMVAISPNYSGYVAEVGLDGVLDKGRIFAAGTVTTEGKRDVGPWMSYTMTGERTGKITCDAGYDSVGNLFDWFVYLYNYYDSKNFNFSVSDVKRVTAQDRIRVVCNGTSAGLMYATSYNPFGDGSPVDCDSGLARAAVFPTEYHPASGRSEWIKKLYNEMRVNSGNEILLDSKYDWENLGDYDELDGYYLYSNDLEVQCNVREGSDSSSTHVERRKIDDSTGKVINYTYAYNDTMAYSFVKNSSGSTEKYCGDIINRMEELIDKYVEYVNTKVYAECKSKIDPVVADKRVEADEKYPASTRTTEEDDAIRALNDEYDRIQNAGEYVSTVNDAGEEQLVARNSTGIAKDYIWQCRSSLPFVEVEVEYEPDLKETFEEGVTDAAFMKACKETVEHLSWVICPVLYYISGAVDGLNQTVEGMF